MDGSSTERQTQHLWLRNDHTSAIILCVEPWANELLIPPGRYYVVVAEGPMGWTLGVSSSDGRITVFGWPGSVLSVFAGRTEILSCSQPMPDIPMQNREPAGDLS
jgi:hypothetical protein